MKIIAYNAMSVNGIIARKNYREDFLSDLDWKVFCNLVKRIRCLITSRKTYDIIKKSKDFNLNDIKNIDKIIVTKNKYIKSIKHNYYVNSPKEAVEKAKSLGYKKALLSGGGIINTQFMKKKLVNEIILNIDSIIIGEGITIFQDYKFEAKLKLLKIKRLAEGILQLNYKVDYAK